MKKSTLLLIIMIVFLCGLLLCSNGKHFSSDDQGRQVQIGWESVNIRKKPSEHSEIIGIFNNGTTVTLTGNSRDYFFKEPVEMSNWSEIELPDGTTAWVVTWALDLE